MEENPYFRGHGPMPYPQKRHRRQYPFQHNTLVPLVCTYWSTPIGQESVSVVSPSARFWAVPLPPKDFPGFPDFLSSSHAG